MNPYIRKPIDKPFRIMERKFPLRVQWSLSGRHVTGPYPRLMAVRIPTAEEFEEGMRKFKTRLQEMCDYLAKARARKWRLRRVCRG